MAGHVGNLGMAWGCLGARHVQGVDNLNMVRAVRGTTGIEGTEASEEEVEEMRTPAGQQVLPRNRARDEQEVRNANEVMG